MSDDILGRLANETGLVAVETMAESATDAPLEQLLTLHLHHFPDHAHVGDELRLARRVGPHDPDVIIHAWLLHVDSVPVGFVIFHTNLRRRIVLLGHKEGIDLLDATGHERGRLEASRRHANHSPDWGR